MNFANMNSTIGKIPFKTFTHLPKHITTAFAFGGGESE